MLFYLVLNSVAERIKFCFVFKILLTVIIAGCQLWILKAFFNRKEVKSTPVGQEMF